MPSILNDHELTELVEAAAEGVTTSRANNGRGLAWDVMGPMQKNNIREAVLPFIFHGTKALADLGWEHRRTIHTVEELMELTLPAVLDCHGGGVAKIEHMAGPGITQKYAEFLFGEDELSVSLSEFATFALPATVLKEQVG